MEVEPGEEILADKDVPIPIEGKAEATPDPIDPKLREQIRSCGYELLSSDYKLTGKGNKARLSEQYAVRCPAGHEYFVLRGNFMPIVNGKPKRACMKCSRKRTNGAKAEVSRNKSLLEFGLEALDPYTDRYTATKWRCLAKGHVFTATWDAVEDRKTGKCRLCKE